MVLFSSSFFQHYRAWNSVLGFTYGSQNSCAYFKLYGWCFKKIGRLFLQEHMQHTTDSLCFNCLQVISQLRILSRSVATGSKFDRELWSNGLSPILNLWKKLNQVSCLYHFILTFYWPITFCCPFPANQIGKLHL